MIDVRNLVTGERLEIRSGMAGDRIVVDRKSEAIHIPLHGDIRVSRKGPSVYLWIREKGLELTTPVAVKVGMALAKNGNYCLHLGDSVFLEIGGEGFTLLPNAAIQVGGALVKMADKADDYQRLNPRRMTA